MRGRLAAAALGALLLAGCSSASDEPRRPSGVREEVAGTAAGLANCREWNEATVQQRKVTVRDLRGQLTEQSSRSERSVLSDERAYQLFERACKEDYASEFRLYKLYVRAAAFEPLRPRPER